VKTVSSPSLRVLYDLYHEQRAHGNLIEKLQQNIALVGLIHVADVPGRHQPGTGELDYGNIYRTLAQLNYTGTIAMEFYPTGDVVTTCVARASRSCDALTLAAQCSRVAVHEACLPFGKQPNKEKEKIGKHLR